jgi:hypothetical protein
MGFQFARTGARTRAHTVSGATRERNPGIVDRVQRDIDRRTLTLLLCESRESWQQQHS